MTSEGDQPPPDNPEDELGADAGADEESGPPSYRIYRSGSDDPEDGTEERAIPGAVPDDGREVVPGSGNAPDPTADTSDEPDMEPARPGEPADPGAPVDPGPVIPPTRPGKPEYKVYRSRGRFSGGRKPGLEGLKTRGRDSGRGGGGRDRFSDISGGGRNWRKWLKWGLIGAAIWILISFISFGISAQIQKGKLSDAAKDSLDGGPGVLAGQNILILGGDQRDKSSNEPGADPSAPPRADSIMILHASLTSFKKLSIPRDTSAAIPGCGTQKINAAFSCNGGRNGNAALTVKTVENFLGIDINHIIIIDFKGFADFIDNLGGVNVNLPQNKKVTQDCKRHNWVVRGDINGGKKAGGISLGLSAGEHTLQADKALALSRLRKNDCDPSEDDKDRAKRQQLILQGIKGRITSPTRFPINFIKGPLLGWSAPKAFISDMGGATLPQVAIAAIFGSGGDPNVLIPSNVSNGNLFVSGSECTKAVKELTGKDPPRDRSAAPDLKEAA